MTPVVSWLEASARAEERAFVGRDTELDVFRRWLLAGRDVTEVLSVSGPGGIGKSALLAAFERAAGAAGWSQCTPDGLDQ